MIEFKGECGHTVRAKDEDAGKVVRCAYCGREAQVPEENAADDFDFFFSTVTREGAPAEGEAKVETVAGKKKSRTVVGYHPRRTVDPFRIVTRMAYVAAVLILVIFVGKKYAWPFISDALSRGNASPTASVSPNEPIKEPIKPAEPAKREGLMDPRLDQRGREGIYVNAVPHDVTVFYQERPASDTDRRTDYGPDWYAWLESPTAARIRDPSFVHELKAGTYDVVVMLPLNDPQLMRTYRPFGYAEFRAEVETERNYRRRDERASEYFIPDGALAVRIIALRDRINIARHYEVTIRAAEWYVLTPLFIPFRCTMRQVAEQIIDKDKSSFGFDEQYIRDELSYYRVPPEDRTYVVDILRRTGSISYHEANCRNAESRDGTYGFRIFKVNPADGIFTARRLEDKERAPFKAAEP